jgi:hypothetical protein
MAKRKKKAKAAATKAGGSMIQNSSFYVNAMRLQRAVVIYTDTWTYVLDSGNGVQKPPIPQQNQYTLFCQTLKDEGYIFDPTVSWNLPTNPPPRN